MIYQLWLPIRRKWRHRARTLRNCRHVGRRPACSESADLLCLTQRIDMTFQAIDATPTTSTHYLIASDFDQTLSFNDSGAVLSEILGASNFHEKVRGLADSNLVQQGGE